MKEMGIIDAIVPFTEKQENCIKKILPIVGGCTLVVGVVIFGVGLGVLISQQHNAEISSVPFRGAPVILLVAGILCIVAGGFLIFVTKCTAITKSKTRRYSLIFIIILLFAALLTFVGAILGFVYAGQVLSNTKDDMTVMVRKFGVTGRYKSLASINKMQSKNKCCGVVNYADWRNSVYAGNRYDKVPDSCCKKEEHACGFEFELSEINREGCLETVEQSLHGAVRLVGIVGIIVFLIEVSLAAIAVVIRKKHFPA